MKIFTTYADYEYKPDYKILLFGVDIMIDRNDRPWLIEMNSGPEMHNDNLRELRMKLIEDCIHMMSIPMNNNSNVHENDVDKTDFVLL
jgi:CO dehydrogenase/acetyl-CoA synthase epsilon subunit